MIENLVIVDLVSETTHMEMFTAEVTKKDIDSIAKWISINYGEVMCVDDPKTNSIVLQLRCGARGLADIVIHIKKEFSVHFDKDDSSIRSSTIWDGIPLEEQVKLAIEMATVKDEDDT